MILRRLLLPVLAAIAIVAFPAGAHGQERPDTTIFEALGLDRLRLISFGVESGVTFPSQMESAPVIALVADYGELRPRWRVAFTASYWESHFTSEAVQRLADSLATIVEDPTGDARVVLDEVSFAALSVTADVRRQLTPWSRLRPYIGGGIGAYATNAEARGLSGTLVENAFDTIAAGVAAIAGVDLFPIPNLVLSMHARYELASGIRAGTLRVGGAYVFNAGEGR